MSTGWIGVDFDGTLAKYDGWKGPTDLGEPIPAMVERVKRWLAEGREVRIFTARVSLAGRPGDSVTNALEMIATRSAIRSWCLEHLGQRLPVTCEKDLNMIELWDDRCVQVEPNTGRRMDGRE